MKITFESSLYIDRINLSNNTLTLNIVYRDTERSGFYDYKANKILFQTSDEYKGIEISDAEIIFENINEIWWDVWWDEDKERVDLNSIDLDNVHWRFDELENLQYNVPNHDVEVNDINDLNVAEWETALSWDTCIEIDSDDLLNSNYHFILNIPHDLLINKEKSRHSRPMHIKGKNVKIETRLKCN